jgi:hypothetical protein
MSSSSTAVARAGEEDRLPESIPKKVVQRCPAMSTIAAAISIHPGELLVTRIKRNANAAALACRTMESPRIKRTTMRVSPSC